MANGMTPNVVLEPLKQWPHSVSLNEYLGRRLWNILQGPLVLSQDHIPLTWWNAPLAHSNVAIVHIMAYLTRRPGTYALRLFLLPLVIIATIRCTVQYRIEDPVYGCYNSLRGFVACAYIAKAVRFALVPEGTLKVGEERLPGLSSGLSENDKTVSGIILAGVRDALEVGFAVRGLSWQFSEGLYVPKSRRPLERHAYIRHTLFSILKAYLFVDIFDYFLGTLPGIDAYGLGGTIFPPSLPAPLRYIASTAIHFAFGIFIITGMSMWYDTVSLVGVGWFGHPPSLWPPMHDRPWRSTSLHEFWSKRWHQCLRDTFLVYGGYLGRWLAGDIGMLFGTFMGSGLFHEVGFYLGGMPMDSTVMLFFLAQALGILVEKGYRAVTGRRIGGWGGRLWVVFMVVVVGQPCTDSWIARGVGGRAIVPPWLSMSKSFLFPILRTVAL